jgi:hypothetical protein
VTITGIALTAGCEGPSKRLNAPPQGHTCYPHELQHQYTPMVDNALLSDMSMSAVHFVPHQSELNGTGVRRLQRYAEIMQTYGGTLHYDGVEDAKDLADARIQRISDFLVDAGLDQSKFKVELGLAGGRGMNAIEAEVIRESTFAHPGQETDQGSQPRTLQVTEAPPKTN